MKNLSNVNRFIAFAVILIGASVFTGCSASSSSSTSNANDAMTGNTKPITEAEVVAAQQAWGEGIVAIGKVYQDGGDVRAAAEAHIREFYAYGQSPILFKPTLAAEDQFRGDFKAALSYFVGGDAMYAEDKGFALAPYTDVRWENEDIIIDADSALAMGNYFFSPLEGDPVKVEYSFAYIRDENGDLKINLHHSSLPFSPSN